MFDSPPVSQSASSPSLEPEFDEVIGSNLRRLRKGRGLSLERFAELTGVSKAMLGQIELGHSVPSIKILWKIAHSLDLPIGTFLSPREGEGSYLLPAHTSNVLVTADGRVRSRVLFPEERSRKVRFYEMEWDGLVSKDSGPHPAGTTENLVVCQGSLVVSVGQSEYRLVTGDALFFDADVPHRYRNPDTQGAKAFLVMNYGE